MGKSKAVVSNMFITAIYQICTIVFGLIVPRFFLVEYGADIHGLTSTITNILSYVALLNAGLLTASVQALYRPLSTNDAKEVNAVLNAVKRYYQKIGVSYSGVVFILALVLPLFVSEELNAITVFGLMLVMGMTSIFDSFLGAKYRVLVQADQKYWLIGLLNTITLIIRSILQIVFIKLHLSVVIVQFVPALMTIITYIFLKVFISRYYKYLNRLVPPNYSALSQRSSALVHQIAGVVVNNTDTIVLTIFTNLTVVSIYSVYQLVFTHLYSLITSVFSTSSVASFGHMLVTDSIEKVRRIYDTYEVLFYFCVSCILATCSILIGPFVNIYTAGVNGIQYYDIKLIVLFMSIAILNNARVPGSMLINAAGHYRKTQMRALAEAIINLTVSLALVGKLGIYGVLIGTVISFLYRTTDIIIYSNHHILSRSSIISIRRECRMTLTIFLTWMIGEKIFEVQILTWVDWVIYGVVFFMGTILLTTIIWLIFDFRSFKEAVLFVKTHVIKRHINNV